MQQLGPSFVKKSPHPVAGPSNFRVVLIKFLTVIKNQVHINNEGLQIEVPVIIRGSLIYTKFFFFLHNLS